MPMVIVCFALANAALYIVLPMDVLGRTNTVAVVCLSALCPHSADI